MNGKRWTITALACAEFLGMAVWFSASAVIPALTDEWKLTGADQAWLTMSVQAGFVIGAFLSSLLNLADYVPSHRLFAESALLASVATALIAVFDPGLSVTLVLRFLTGFFLAGVYPVGMKIIATWTTDDRGFGIGVLVGALTLGSAAPHLINAFGEIRSWQAALSVSAALAFVGSAIVLLFVREGPYQTTFRKFNWKYIGEVFSTRELALANLGYLGHMWELYAMWAWIPLFLLSSLKAHAVSAPLASLCAFAVIGIGGIGSVLAGSLADRLGRTTVTMGSMLISGSCAILAGFLYAGTPLPLLIVCLVWGFSVVADSAQFSACITELCRTEYLGTALTLQTSLGFLLTMITIRMIPALAEEFGWGPAFAVLSVGPAFGIWAMNELRKHPAAARLAGGRK